MAEHNARELRVRRLLQAADTLRQPSSPAGAALRQRVAKTSGLSLAGIELGLERCLEGQPTPAELAALLTAVPEASAAHVLLSANVFVAALRAIAIGVACSSEVTVRASRRDPALAEALHALTPELFRLVPELLPAPGAQLWAYGSSQTLVKLRATLPMGVVWHPHGSGFGAVVVEATSDRDVLAEARAIAMDSVLFDQRGCLSPRLVCVVGSEQATQELGQALSQELAELEARIPLGLQNADDLAEARRFRDAASYAFELIDAGSGAVSVAQNAELMLPPPGRHLHVTRVSDAVGALLPLKQHLTCIGHSGSAELRRRLTLAFPGARLASLGEMQRPPLDGPVDRRGPPAGELID